MRFEKISRRKGETSTPHTKTIPLDWLVTASVYCTLLKNHFSFYGQIVFIWLLYLCNFPPISSICVSSFEALFFLTTRGESSSRGERCYLHGETERARGQGQWGGQALLFITRSFCSLKIFHMQHSVYHGASPPNNDTMSPSDGWRGAC